VSDPRVELQGTLTTVAMTFFKADLGNKDLKYNLKITRWVAP
jgi:hypothetical protein